MLDLNAMPRLTARHLRHYPVFAKARRGDRKPRTGRDDPRRDGAAFDELAQPGFDKYSVLRPGGARIQRRERQDLHKGTDPRTWRNRAVPSRDA